MNLTVLKSTSFWITAVSAIVALLLTSGVILSGSTVDHVMAYVVAILGAVTGHSMQSTAAPAPAPAPTATPPAS